MDNKENYNFSENSKLNTGNTLHLSLSQQKDFVKEIKQLGIDIRKNTNKYDFFHLKKYMIWGKVATLIGYSTAWLLPNPISVFLISLGNYARWSLVYHTLSHGALDMVKDIPARYRSTHFAHGYRRYIDWLDWIVPVNWHTEHNILHHFHLGTDKDPDIVRRNTEDIWKLNAPLFVKKLMALGLACTWKFSYYAPNTLVEHRFQKGLSEINSISLDLWNPFKKTGREIWIQSILPYFIFRFVLIPSLFLFIGFWPFIFVLINSIFAELLTNIHSFVTIATNHTGDDICTFEGRPKNQAEHYFRQIVGTVNFPTGSPIADFFYGGMNYQIEHHLWPDASLRQYQLIQPQLKELCNKYCIPYKQEPLLSRIKVLFRSITLQEVK